MPSILVPKLHRLFGVKQSKNLPELLKQSRRHFRDNAFTPFNVLREMDLAGGTLSYKGIDVLRRVETAGLKRYHGSMIPSMSEIKRMASMDECVLVRVVLCIEGDNKRGIS